MGLPLFLTQIQWKIIENGWNYVDNLNLEIKTYEKIYVSRQKAKNRKIENNNEVVSIFRKHGYEVSFEDYNFWTGLFDEKL